MQRWGMHAKAFRPTGNHAFYEYRQETLKRLEEEADAFQSFLERLRTAKHRTEFEQFMAERRNRQNDNGASGPSPEQPGGPAPQPGA